MENAKKIRLRAPNFTSKESLHLCEIIENYKHIIENKRSDGASLQDKHNAWLKVVEEYNAPTASYARTLESLQQCYKNIKRKTKKQYSDSKMSWSPVNREILIDAVQKHGSNDWQKISNSVGVSQEQCLSEFTVMKDETIKYDKDVKKDILATGGGPSKQPNSDPLLDKVRGLIGPTLDGVYTIYDGDSSLMVIQGIQPIEEQNNCLAERPTQSQEKTQTEEPSLFTNNRANLKKKPNLKLVASKQTKKNAGQETVQEKFKRLATEKTDLVTLQKELALKQILVEEERLSLLEVQNEMIRKEKNDLEEKIEHNRRLRMLEMEEVKKRMAHSDLLRKLELEKL